MARKQTPPTTSSTAFDCPYCGAFTSQTWFTIYADIITRNDKLPFVPNQEYLEELNAIEDPEPGIDQLREMCEPLVSGELFLERRQGGATAYHEARNLFLSRCYNCNGVAVWVHQSLVFPPQRLGPEPNADLPADIQHDFEEARSIVNWSPRGAAALLRLCVQKLCAFLGESGKNIDTDIARLVGKGLNSVIQQSLDVLRVIGNEAVHPGEMDLRDDRDTAIQLFSVVNFIANQMISQPKEIAKMYDGLPDAKKEAIEKRNKRAIEERAKS